MTDELAALWDEAEQHLRSFEQLARRTVEEAWLAGDALLRIKDQLPHGAWTPALKERGIAPTTARRFIQLRKQYPQIDQIGRFGSVSAALTDKKLDKAERDTPAKPHPITAYLVSADDLWDWERGEPTALARRLLDADELQEFSENMKGEIRLLVESFKSDELVSAGLYMMRRLSCHVNIGPLKEDADAIAETKLRLSVFSDSVDQLVEGAKTEHDDTTI